MKLTAKPAKKRKVIRANFKTLRTWPFKEGSGEIFIKYEMVNA